jgi:archaellum component FlaC
MGASLGDAMRITPWIPLSQLAKMMGLAPTNGNLKKMRLKFRAIESAKGVQLLFKTNQSVGRGVRYGVTLAQLEQHVPEIFDKTTERIDAIAQEVKARFSDINEKLEEHEDKIEAIRMLVRQVLKERDAARCR